VRGGQDTARTGGGNCLSHDSKSKRSSRRSVLAYVSCMDVNQRIAQFETMVRPEADPNNDMAWFSLGKAYAEAGRHEDAARAFSRCAELNPGMSKAYQLAGESYIAVGELSRAAEVLRKGYVAARSRGDHMPMKAIGELLERIGEEVPVAEPSAGGASVAVGGFVCRRTGRPGTKMAKAPFKGPVGAWIAENIAKETWDAWIAHGTKVINELRLDLSRDEDSEIYDRHMREFLGIDDELLASLTGRRS
jgi:Fe-S cluster biosynthesis and repair protein YggX